MADYEFHGLRQDLIKNPHADLCRLEACAAHDASLAHLRLMEGLKNYFDKDIVAIYTRSAKNYKMSNNFTGNLFVRGRIHSADSNELIFHGPEGTTPSGLRYRGSTWIVPVSQLVDVVPVEDYFNDANPFGLDYISKDFIFTTMAGDDMGNARAITPMGAYLSMIGRLDMFQRELKTGPTTPIKLKEIKEMPLEETIRRNGTGTGTGF